MHSINANIYFIWYEELQNRQALVYDGSEFS